MSVTEDLKRERAARQAAEARLAVLEASTHYEDPAVGLVAALADSQDGVAMWSPDHVLLACNTAYKAIFSHNAKVRPGLSYAQLIDLAYEKRLAWPEELEGSDWRSEFIARFDGQDLPSTIMENRHKRLFRLQNRRTTSGGTLAIISDITSQTLEHRKAIQEKLDAQAASNAKSAFLANMSHEIRTPMNGVVGMADLLNETELDEEQQLYAKTIRNSAEALLVIINDVLDYSKLEAEKLVLQPEVFDLEHLIHEVVMLLQPAAQDKGVDLLVDYDLFLPTHFTADPGRLRQILTNLLGNAVKFTDEGHVLVRVTGLPEGEGSEMRLHIAIEDTGIGIPPEKVASIFGKYAQVDDPSHQRANSTGLGLTISKELVSLMEGEIWVDSVEGEGSVFGFQITVPHEPAPPEIHSVATTDLQSVLVIDDLEVNITILRKQLESIGLTVFSATDTDKAQAILNERPIDLVITDHVMPRKSGLEFAKELRAAGDMRPLLLLSSNPFVARASNAREVFDIVLQKPLARHALLSALDQLQGRRQATAKGDALQKSGQTGTPSPSNQTRMKILTAEDNATNRLVFEKMVKNLDVDLVFAKDGVEAVHLWQEHQPDLVFMDISMPEKDGYEATRDIRAQESKRTPICSLTAHIEVQANRGECPADFDRALTKPLKKAQLLEVISEFRPKSTMPLMSGSGQVA